MNSARILAVLMVAGTFALAQVSDAPKGRNVRDFLGLGPAPDMAAAKLGEPLYKDNCATCHGPTARGSQGPNLVRSPVVLHDEKGEGIGPVVKNGRPAGGMPSFPDLGDSQIYAIAEYIHLQVELAANRGTYNQTYSSLHNQVSGDPAKGRAFFDGNCAGCHSATGDLAKIGAKYPQASVISARFLWPVSGAPKQATVTTKEGEKMAGTLLTFDDFDVSLRDASGEPHSWPRSEVTVELTDKLAGHRALLPRYKDADLHNLTAYLVTLK
jgi:cytochrome c oxidase cbb3-type subunit 3